MRGTNRFWLIALLLLCDLAGELRVALGQTAHDLLYYSHYAPVMSARSVGLGSAIGAVGGDVAAMAINPGAMGLYRSWDLGLSASLIGQNSQGQDLGTGQQSNRFGMFAGFNSSGFVMYFPKSYCDSAQAFRGFTIGLGFNKLIDFTRISQIQRETTGVTILDALADLGNRQGLLPEKLEAKNAYQQYDHYLVNAWQGFGLDSLVSLSPPNFGGFSAPFKAGDRVLEEQTQRASGGMNEIGFNFSMNLWDRLFLGATLDVAFLNHRWVTTHRIEQREDVVSGFTQGSIRVINQDVGAGMNLKLGMVGYLGEHIRLGLALHTPTMLSVVSTQEMVFKAYRKGDQQPNKSADSKSEFKYSYVSPMRVVASIAGVLGKRAIISADYHMSLTPTTHFVNYRPTRDEGSLDFVSSDEFKADNDFIRGNTQITHQVNAGGELLLGIVALRVGGGFSTSPYRNGEYTKYLPAQYFINTGLGFSFSKTFYMDFACRYTRRMYDFALYNFGNPAFAAYAKSLNTSVNFLVGLGFKF